MIPHKYPWCWKAFHDHFREEKLLKAKKAEEDRKCPIEYQKAWGQIYYNQRHLAPLHGGALGSVVHGL